MRTDAIPPANAAGPGMSPAPPGILPEPGKVTTLRSRRSPLAQPAEQRRILADLRLQTAVGEEASFEAAIAAHGHACLRPTRLEYYQINLGQLCNMTCRHCHVDAGPDRAEQMMSDEVIEDCLRALDLTDAHTVDLTGGAPELHPRFRDLIQQVRERGRHVVDRCNLTILLIPGFHDLPRWLADHEVEIVCSLPHYRQRNTDAQRGRGTFKKSIAALRRLNAAGYGQGDPRRRLSIMTNPSGAFLAGNQRAMEPQWHAALAREHGVTFDSLVALNNIPIARFLEWLQDSDNLQEYMTKLISSFNPQTIDGLMCRKTISISWRGLVYDCDFNQMLHIPCRDAEGRPLAVRDFEAELFGRRPIRTARHCFGCTAGSGSSCGGALAG